MFGVNAGCARAPRAKRKAADFGSQLIDRLFRLVLPLGLASLRTGVCCQQRNSDALNSSDYQLKYT